MMKKTAATLSAIVIVGAAAALLANQMTDRVESSAKKSYVFKNFLKSDDIKIKATDAGDVTLTGTVGQWSHRVLAEETVAGITGVVRVDNKLEVKGDNPAENSDGWIGAKVKTMLLFHRNVSGIKTEVDVKSGVVTLRGEAGSDAEKELTTEYAKDVEGVQSVKNEMTVAKTTKATEKNIVEQVGDNVDDASITAQVKLALLFHRSTSAIATKVATKDGIVTVSGVAKNSAEKALVDKLVHNVKGVKGLKNEMTTG